MNDIADQEVDEIAQKIMTEIEHTKSRELADSDEMIKILHLTNTRHAKNAAGACRRTPYET